LRYEFYQTFKRHEGDLVQFRGKIFSQSGGYKAEDTLLEEEYYQRTNSLEREAKWLFFDKDDKFAKSIKKGLENKHKSINDEYNNDPVCPIDSEINKGFDEYLTIK
jgi:hypothetical protein